MKYEATLIECLVVHNPIFKLISDVAFVRISFVGQYVYKCSYGLILPHFPFFFFGTGTFLRLTGAVPSSAEGRLYVSDDQESCDIGSDFELLRLDDNNYFCVFFSTGMLQWVDAKAFCEGKNNLSFFFYYYDIFSLIPQWSAVY